MTRATAAANTPLCDDVQIILEHQDEGGAYVASPAYSQYPYCWLRDGSFVAHAMDAVGERQSAARFHAWAARAVLGIEDAIRSAIEAADAGGNPDHGRMPPARFTLDARLDHEGDWPNFQIDGYGQWLWSLREHLRRTSDETGDAAPEVLAAAELVAEYLARFWSEPCFDAWEEGRTQHHTSTLASSCAGLQAAGEFVDARYAAIAKDVWAYILERCTIDGRFRKAVRSASVDASLVWLATPFDLIRDNDPLFAETLQLLERELVCDGGVLRYPEDTFYGGGTWILLTAWLAWHHARVGRPERAGAYLAWVERQRAADGGLPEQVTCSRTDAWFHAWWTRRWGPAASPLLWSHAMVILARTEVAEVVPGW